ncbi:riboflavin synthase subunit alpha [Candidatus Nomurabacteria bacterium RIFCSPHIGHO2_02_FULL_37_45]|uniref:Riboflavin synthase n=2 Tax=Candidatus Nomuraibacteriota TaxID=1752729 RepID=A0A1F6Y317_9BACT|nr:MAG: riboflavin synthase subunit alpha [Candidatus Nomurabacteria bacterium RIFCSPHIGHO2_01_FULL_37_110]OGI71322.1 MAG: riboflavin synthase subunit alpha [Candidatus Nomurabacteria bacterium RIFCSPHIGHO2_02_FULL_37_45]OGI79550.1 MAG: riboflavin synthase subunit alpha [Candidatus Nomurabacteria bacterium RIFCSPHIGHO2_12_FULL_37_29]OGI85433.1 MAG: riboflavin synthase subunit alpha [Candidatus Nomurabacteria bacterium RIFCSPLOWO2_01_FULL_37_49]OGJ00725.1 MAG: riboflavin synthase subunit alpha [
MFTGIISKTAKVKNVKHASGGLSLEISNSLKKIKIGESISVNGVCSTVKKIGKNVIFEYMPETLRLSNLDSLQKDDTVNIEQSLKFGDNLDGHIMLGHVDGAGKIVSIKKEGNSSVFEIEIPAQNFRKYLAYKGSVAVEGISLTVAKVLKNSFIVKIIPHTLRNTNLKYKKKGDIVNLEFDILAKYANANKK